MEGRPEPPEFEGLVDEQMWGAIGHAGFGEFDLAGGLDQGRVHVDAEIVSRLEVADEMDAAA